MRSDTSGLDRRLTTTVHRIIPGPDGTSSADAGVLASAQAADVSKIEAVSFMFASVDRAVGAHRSQPARRMARVRTAGLRSKAANVALFLAASARYSRVGRVSEQSGQAPRNAGSKSLQSCLGEDTPGDRVLSTEKAIYVSIGKPQECGQPAAIGTTS
jgi:hypothetical protein